MRDPSRARSFYEALGWIPSAAFTDDVAFFQAGGMVLGLWDRTRLAEDSGVEEARSAGTTISREPAETFWGGYSRVFVDPDGHPWEVAHNPEWRLSEDGSVELPS